MEKLEVKYIYSATGVQICEIEEILDKSGINEEIDEIVDTTIELMKNENFDRTQLEMYVTNQFQFKLLAKIMAKPLYIEKCIEKQTKEGKDEK